jgi:hypothetical protein
MWECISSIDAYWAMHSSSLLSRLNGAIGYSSRANGNPVESICVATTKNEKARAPIKENNLDNSDLIIEKRVSVE